MIDNTGAAPVHNLDYIRSINPDQEYPWNRQFVTRNYVAFQRRRASDGLDRSHPTTPNTCSVVAEGSRLPQVRTHACALRLGGRGWVFVRAHEQGCLCV